VAIDDASWRARSPAVLRAVVQRLHRDLTDYVARLPRRTIADRPLGGTDFELCLLAWLRPISGVQGARQIGKSGDYGGDILFQVGTSRVVLQAKSYSGKVGTSSVQEVFAARQNYSCNVAAVVTNSDFTLPAQRLAKRVGVRLVERASSEAVRRLIDAIQIEARSG
jgi:HJR/Mrr/RecB family endonuclease